MGTIYVKPALLRGALFGALYVREFARMNLNTATSAPKLDYSSEVTPVPTAFVAQRAFADCVVRTSPAKAHALLLAEVSSPTEAAAFDALSFDMGGCLDGDGSISFSHEMLRGLLAEAAYKLARAATSTAAVPPMTSSQRH